MELHRTGRAGQTGSRAKLSGFLPWRNRLSSLVRDNIRTAARTALQDPLKLMNFSRGDPSASQTLLVMTYPKQHETFSLATHDSPPQVSQPVLFVKTPAAAAAMQQHSEACQEPRERDSSLQIGRSPKSANHVRRRIEVRKNRRVAGGGGEGGCFPSTLFSLFLELASCIPSIKKQQHNKTQTPTRCPANFCISYPS